MAFPFFETLNDRNTNNYFEKNAFIYLCKKAKLEKHPDRKILFKEGDISNGKMYLLYSGEVSLMSTNQGAYFTPSEAKSQVLPTKDEPNDIDTKEVQPSKITVPSIKPEILITAVKEPSNIIHSNAPQSKQTSLNPTPRRRARSRAGGYPGVVNDLNSSVDSDRSKSVNTSTGSAKRLLVTSPSSQLKMALMFKTQTRESIRPSRRLGSQLRVLQGGEHAMENNQGQEIKKSVFGLKAKLKAVTRLTLSSIRMGRLTASAESSKRPSKEGSMIEEEEEPEDFETMLAKYGTSVGRVEKGGSIGEKALFSNYPVRTETAITNTPCEFLVINKRDFQYIVQNYDSKRRHIIQFMIDFIPDVENINSYELLENLLNTLKEKTYERGSYIIQEGEAGDDIYILYDGSCEIIKNIRVDDSINFKDQANNFKKMLRVGTMQSSQLSVCTIQKGVFIGEEILYHARDSYNFSVKATSAAAKVFAISKTDFLSKFPSEANTDVQEIYNNKVTKYAALIKDLISARYPDMKILQSTHSDKELETFLNYGQVVLGPKGKKNAQDTRLNTDSSVGSPQSKLIILKSQKTLLSRRYDELVTQHSFENSKYRKSTDPDDIAKVKKNISPFRRNIGSPHRIIGIASPPNVGTKAPMLNIREELGQNILGLSIILDGSPSHFKSPQSRQMTRLLLTQTSSIVKSGILDATVQTKPRLLELKTMTDCKFDLGAGDGQSPSLPGEQGAALKVKRKTTYELDDPKTMLIDDLPEETGTKTNKSGKRDLFRSYDRADDPSVSPNSRYITADRVQTFIKRTKNKVSKRMAISTLR